MPTSCVETASSIDLGNIITWVVVVGGWVFTNKANHYFETRKEINQTISTINKELLEICKKGKKFHLMKSHNSELLDEIITSIDREDVKIKLLKRSLVLDTHVVDIRIYEFRRSISLNNADKSSFKKLTPGDEILKDIDSAHNKLSEYLQECYYKKFF